MKPPAPPPHSPPGRPSPGPSAPQSPSAAAQPLPGPPAPQSASASAEALPGPPTRPSPGVLEVVQPAGWARPQGYANALAGRGRLVFVAGQVGWDPATCAVATDDLAAQTAQALANLVAVLRTAGALPQHVARLTWYVTDRDEYQAARGAIGAAYRAHMGGHYPAMSLVPRSRSKPPP
jgi:enamine deaminase RidA (YjgF/YER057c/UK114 family)